MADIKFMDISQNNNPATTDSILVGNKENGLKRTTLGTIGNMFSVHKALHFEKVSVKINSNGDDVMYPISAPNINGYTFVTWINVASIGFILPAYVEDPLSQSSKIWAPIMEKDYLNQCKQDPNSYYMAIAMYIKNEMA